VRYLTINQAAEKPNCPYTTHTLRYFIKKKKLRQIVVPGGEGEYVKVGGMIRFIEANFDLWIHRKTYPGAEAVRRGVPMARTGRR
jgi:hypothetical protein